MNVVTLGKIVFKKCFNNNILTQRNSFLSHSQKIWTRKKNSDSFDFKSLTSTDLELYKIDKKKYFATLNIFAFVQFVFWSSSGLFFLQKMKEPEIYSKAKVWEWLHSKKTEYNTILGCTAIFFGCSIFAGTLFYTSRSVRSITLHKGGKNLTVVTYKPIGGSNYLNVLVTEVSATQSRAKATTFLPLKVKNKYFYYLLDMQGKFSYPKLFDFTAGIKRSL